MNEEEVIIEEVPAEPVPAEDAPFEPIQSHAFPELSRS